MKRKTQLILLWWFMICFTAIFFIQMHYFYNVYFPVAIESFSESPEIHAHLEEVTKVMMSKMLLWPIMVFAVLIGGLIGTYFSKDGQDK
ncbi:MAG: hypothetical protein V3V50_00645 [Gammaproteobacteria bacterium]